MAFNPKTQFLITRAQTLLSAKTQLNSFWQNVAYNFYPQRAFFTRTSPFPYGRDFASNLTTSYPLLIARDLASSISTYLRPAGEQWFKISIANNKKEKILSNESRQFLEWATEQQSNFIYDRESGFQRAVDQGDYDYSVFGQCVISIEIDYKTKNLLHRCWLLRDVAWQEAANGQINFVVRQWKTNIRQAYAQFGDKLSPQTIKRLAEEGDCNITLYHIVMTNEDYYTSYSDTATKDRKIKLPFVSIYCQLEEEHEIECVGSPTMIYCIPRWQTVSGSQYAYSPAIVAALPDARLLQSITLSLLEAGEKAVNPPMIAHESAVRSDISLIANTISWIQEGYEGKADDAVKIMNLDRSGLQYGLQMQVDTRAQLTRAFYLDKLSLPVFDAAMTATEVRQRIQEWIRSASPLFSTLQSEYNSQMCKMQFDTLMHVRAFGAPETIPEELQGETVDFTFTSPLIEAKGADKGQKFIEMMGAVAQTIQLDPSVRFLPNATLALRDALDGQGIPAKWLNDEDEVEEMKANEQQAQQQQQFIQTLAQGGQAAEQIGKGAQAINQAGLE
ncbi:MAG: portal protein [bacterium]